MGGLACICELAETQPHVLNLDSVSLYGVSGGAFAALLCAMKIQPVEIHNLYLSKFGDYEVMSITSGVAAMNWVVNYLIDLHNLDLTILSNRLHIGVSTPFGFRWITEFTSNNHLMSIIANSCTIPIAIPRNDVNHSQIDGCISISVSDIPIHNTLHILKPPPLKTMVLGFIPIPIIPIIKPISRLYFELGVIEAKKRVCDYMEFGKDAIIWYPISPGVCNTLWHLHGL